VKNSEIQFIQLAKISLREVRKHAVDAGVVGARIFEFKNVPLWYDQYMPKDRSVY
jgi:hypothetical protein